MYSARNSAFRHTNPLENYGDLKLSTEQKKLIRTAGDKARRAAERKAKSRDLKKRLVPQGLAQKDFFIIPAGAEQRVREQYSLSCHTGPVRHEERINKHLAMLSLIYNAHRPGVTELDDAVELNSQILRELLGKEKNFNYKHIRENLVKWGLIKVSSYLSGKYVKQLKKESPNAGIQAHCRRYQFTQEFLKQDFIVTLVAGLKFRARVDKDKLARKRSQLAKAGQLELQRDDSLPHIKWLKKCLGRVTIDLAVFEWVNEQARLLAPRRDKLVKLNGGYKLLKNRVFTRNLAHCYQNMVHKFNFNQTQGTPEFDFSITNGRLNTGLTRQFKQTWEYLQVDGKPVALTGWDLSASQVYLLLSKLSATNAGKLGGADLEDFGRMVVGGKFYNELAKSLQDAGLKLNEDEDCKAAFFRHVLFSRKHRATGFRKVFNQVYPTVNSALMELVTDFMCDEESGEIITIYKNLAVMLQQEESDLFLNKICLRLHQVLGDDAIVLTLHDGIYCEPQHCQIVFDIMMKVLAEATGINPNIKSTSKTLVAETDNPSTDVQAEAIEQPSCMHISGSFSLNSYRGIVEYYGGSNEKKLAA